MNCPKFMSLTEAEQKIYIGSLVHSAISDNLCYEAGEELIELAAAKGKFEGVKIGGAEVYHDPNIEKSDESLHSNEIPKRNH